MTLRFERRRLASRASHFTVLYVNRRPGLAAGATIADVAADHAAAIEHELGGPVAVEGVSTDGSVALQLAADWPDLVSRLVVVAAACRLPDDGRQIQRCVARLMAEGRARRAWAALGSRMAGTPAGNRLMAGLMWLAGGAMRPTNAADRLITLAAEDSSI